MKRIDRDEQGIDDVAVDEVSLARIERLDDDCFWVAFYGKGRTRVAFHIRGKGLQAFLIEDNLEQERK